MFEAVFFPYPYTKLGNIVVFEGSVYIFSFEDIVTIARIVSKHLNAALVFSGRDCCSAGEDGRINMDSTCVVGDSKKTLCTKRQGFSHDLEELHVLNVLAKLSPLSQVTKDIIHAKHFRTFTLNWDQFWWFATEKGLHLQPERSFVLSSAT